MSEKKLGILGGMGPAASDLFLHRLIALTPARKDQDHLDTVLISQASTPDRTAYILGESQENPGPVLVKNAKALQAMGCDYLAMTCNTAHYFAEDIRKAVDIPFIHMIEEAVREAKKRGLESLAFMGTPGTVKTGLYEKECERQGLTYFGPDRDQQAAMNRLIFDQVKAGQPVDYGLYQRLLDSCLAAGADGVVAGCTELSVIHQSSPNKDQSYIVDAMEVLAIRCLEFAGIDPLVSTHS